MAAARCKKISLKGTVVKCSEWLPKPLNPGLLFVMLIKLRCWLMRSWWLYLILWRIFNSRVSQQHPVGRSCWWGFTQVLTRVLWQPVKIHKRFPSDNSDLHALITSFSSYVQAWPFSLTFFFFTYFLFSLLCPAFNLVWQTQRLEKQTAVSRPASSCRPRASPISTHTSINVHTETSAW